MFELIDAQTVAEILDEDRGRMEEMGERCAELLRRLHGIELDAGALPDRKEKMLDWVESVACILEPSEAEELRAFIRAVPDRRTFLHGDFNAKNIMVQENGEFMLIDIGDAALGHPVFDLAGMMMVYLFLSEADFPEEEKRRVLGFDLEDSAEYWSILCRCYFGLDDPTEVERRSDALMPYARLVECVANARLVCDDEEGMRQVLLPAIRERLLPLIRVAQPLTW